MTRSKILALDIGGANLKAADGLGYAVSRFFPLWQKPHDLAEAVASLAADAPDTEIFAVTMTGELADCFQTKVEGVSHILKAVEQVAQGRRVLVYRTDGRLVSADEARDEPLAVAAANWHALASFAGRFARSGAGLSIDIGSTTCDLIPFVGGLPAAIGKTDPERLAAGELVYTGVVRSPVCAVVTALPWRGMQVPVAQELFATTRDAYLIAGDLPEELDDCQTADGRPATCALARERLARQICADRTMFSDDDARAAAVAVARTQLSKIALAAQMVLRRLPAPPGTVVISGQGEFLALRLLDKLRTAAEVVSLADMLGPVASQAATAHALAELVRRFVNGVSPIARP